MSEYPIDTMIDMFEAFDDHRVLPINTERSFEAPRMVVSDVFNLDSSMHCVVNETVGSPLEVIKSFDKKSFGFELDSFQKLSLSVVDKFSDLVVSAHTSSGKTVVAEYAIACCLLNNQRCIYTSPIKALSNQKYRELLALSESGELFNTGYVQSREESNNHGSRYGGNPIVDSETVMSSDVETISNCNTGTEFRTDGLNTASNQNIDALINGNTETELGFGSGNTTGTVMSSDLTDMVQNIPSAGCNPPVQKPSVGLLTGDVTINPDASVLVMTTEILRNMLYKGSSVLKDIGYVIFDEIHYLKDPERGVVWEEAIILSPKHFRFLFLSATIPNSVEFCSWVSSVVGRGVHLVCTCTRVVPLEHFFWVRNKPYKFLYDRVSEPNKDKGVGMISTKGWDNQQQNSEGVQLEKGDIERGGKHGHTRNEDRGGRNERGKDNKSIRLEKGDREGDGKHNHTRDKTRKYKDGRRKKEGFKGSNHMRDEDSGCKDDEGADVISTRPRDIKGGLADDASIETHQKSEDTRDQSKTDNSGSKNPHGHSTQHVLDPRLLHRYPGGLPQEVSVDDLVHSKSTTYFDKRVFAEASRNVQLKRRVDELDISSVVSHLHRESLLPAIVFAFSRKECEAHALGVSLDLLKPSEKQRVTDIFDAAVLSLQHEERSLPLITQLKPLLVRGIGIHHAGLLPIIKEVVEILFQENLLRLLFATETFSIGLNMPCKCVVFSSVTKFDGENRRLLSGGEYIQMSGRAGRRNVDAAGTVLVMLNERLSMKQAGLLFSGRADALNSAFRLSYNMLLSLMRVCFLDPIELIKRSFFYFQSQQALSGITQKLGVMEKHIRAILDEELGQGASNRCIDPLSLDNRARQIKQLNGGNNAVLGGNSPEQSCYIPSVQDDLLSGGHPHKQAEHLSAPNNGTDFDQNTLLGIHTDIPHDNLDTPFFDSLLSDIVLNDFNVHFLFPGFDDLIFSKYYLSTDLSTNLSLIDPNIPIKIEKIINKLDSPMEMTKDKQVKSNENSKENKKIKNKDIKRPDGKSECLESANSKPIHTENDIPTAQSSVTGTFNRNNLKNQYKKTNSHKRGSSKADNLKHHNIDTNFLKDDYSKTGNLKSNKHQTNNSLESDISKAGNLEGNENQINDLKSNLSKHHNIDTNLSKDSSIKADDLEGDKSRLNTSPRENSPINNLKASNLKNKDNQDNSLARGNTMTDTYEAGNLETYDLYDKKPRSDNSKDIISKTNIPNNMRSNDTKSTVGQRIVSGQKLAPSNSTSEPNEPCLFRYPNFQANLMQNILLGYAKTQLRRNTLTIKHFENANYLKRGRLVSVFIQNNTNCFLFKHCKITKCSNYLEVEVKINKQNHFIKIQKKNIKSIQNVLCMNNKAMQEAVKNGVDDVHLSEVVPMFKSMLLKQNNHKDNPTLNKRSKHDSKFMKSRNEKSTNYGNDSLKDPSYDNIPLNKHIEGNEDVASQNKLAGNSKKTPTNSQTENTPSPYPSDPGNKHPGSINKPLNPNSSNSTAKAPKDQDSPQAELEEILYLDKILSKIESRFMPFLFLNQCLLCKSQVVTLECINNRCLDQTEIEKSFENYNEDSRLSIDQTNGTTSTIIESEHPHTNQSIPSKKPNYLKNDPKRFQKYYSCNEQSISNDREGLSSIHFPLNEQARYNRSRSSSNFSSYDMQFNQNSNILPSNVNSEISKKKQTSNHSFFNVQQIFDNLNSQYIKNEYIQSYKQSLTKYTDLKNIYHLSECKKMINVLRRLSYYDKQITIKGKIACEISTANEILITEMIFNNIFTTLPIDEIIALLSCLIFHETDNNATINQINKKNYENLKTLMKRVTKTMNECGLETKYDDWVKKYSWEMMDTAQAWANGSTFNEICSMSNIFEGSIIRALRRIEEQLKQLCSAAREIGNTEMENTFASGILRIKRDIVFSSSLYL